MYDVLKYINHTTYFEEQRVIKVKAVKENTTTIPKERWGVHRRHCCHSHGCKYGDIDCPVEIGLLEQDHPCEDCVDVF